MKTFLNLILFTIIACLTSCTIELDKNGRPVSTEYNPKARADADRQRQLAIQEANRQAELDRRSYIEIITQPSGGNGGGHRTPTQQAIYEKEVEFQKAQLQAIEMRQQPRYYNPAASALQQGRQATYGQ